jgi:hypothetical protein
MDVFVKGRIIWQFFDDTSDTLANHRRRRALEDKRIAMGEKR